MASERYTCAKKVWHQQQQTFLQCGRTATYLEEGGAFCGWHAPSRQKARKEKSDAAWRAERDVLAAESNRRSAIAAAKERVVAAAKTLRPLLENEAAIYIYVPEDFQVALEALETAQVEFYAAVDALEALEQSDAAVDS